MQALAGVYKNLALSSADLEAVRLHDYLDDICDRLRDGMLSPAVLLEFEADEATVPNEKAIRIGLIVNELVTNAAKHAFPDGVGTITVRLERSEDILRLIVEDDGKGLGNAEPTDGLGTKLVSMLARQIGAKLETISRDGTTYRLTMPILAAKTAST